MSTPNPAALISPGIGTLVHDTVKDKVGEYRGSAGGRWMLRPPGGGVEWEVEPGAVERAGTYEHLRARNAEANARSRGDMV